MDNTEKFTGRAATYAAARPAYAPALFHYLKAAEGVGPTSVVGDIGAGTGIFSAQMLQLGCRVIAVEPNADMRRQAERLCADTDRLRLVDGRAEATGLAAQSLSFITVAQAFHWFQPVAFGLECRRLLKPGGRVLLVWNNRKTGGAQERDNAAICKAFCPAFTGFGGGKGGRDDAVANFFAIPYHQLSYPNDLCYTKESFLQRMLSASYAPTPKEENYTPFLQALETHFEAYAQGGVLCLENRTEAYVGIPDA